MSEPLYNSATRPHSVFTLPPFFFPNVTARIFPLRARITQLRHFVDSYLNFVPKEVGEFQPFAPFVFLVALDYGRGVGSQIRQGWISQFEYAFFLPLEWYRMEYGRRVFKGWVIASPFIYVDNELSLSNGREVYGWGKTFATTAQSDGFSWLRTFQKERTCLDVQMKVIPELYSGERIENESILKIICERSPRVLGAPFVNDRKYDPSTILQRLLKSQASLLGTVAEIVARPRSRGYWAPGSSRTTGQLVYRILDSLRRSLGRGPDLNVLTLKQFRDAENPQLACYQALVRSRMEVVRLNRFGLSGESSLLVGDSTGGYEVRIGRYSAQPIVETLGLVTKSDNGDVAALDPFFPFWVDVDLRYHLGTTIAWRGIGTKWFTNTRKSSTFDSPEPIDDCYYNTSLSAAVPTLAGPYSFPNSTVRVLPLLACHEKLRVFVGKTFKDFQGELREGKVAYKFEPWGRYVYLIIASHEDMSSEADNIGLWGNKTVEFAVPIKIYKQNPEEEKVLIGVSLVIAYSFSDNSNAAINDREALGLPTLKAEIESESASWLDESGPAEPATSLASVETLVDVGVGQEIVNQRLLSIYKDMPIPYNSDIEWRFVAFNWLDTLLKDLKRKIRTKERKKKSFTDLKALAVEVLANRNPINLLSLRQIRDAEDPGSLCYQSLVSRGRTIDRVYDLREIEGQLHVDLQAYRDLPISEVLGLIPKFKKKGNLEVFQPVRPFWMRVAFREDLGFNLATKIAGSSESKWKLPESLYFLGEGLRMVGPKLVDRIEKIELNLTSRTSVELDDWTLSLEKASQTGSEEKGSVEDVYGEMADRLKAFESSENGVLDDEQKIRRKTKRQYFERLAKSWFEETQEDCDPSQMILASEEAAEAVEEMEPQLAIESILSKDWGNWGNPRWYQGLEDKPDFCIPAFTIGSPQFRKKFLKGSSAENWVTFGMEGEKFELQRVEERDSLAEKEKCASSKTTSGDSTASAKGSS